MSTPQKSWLMVGGLVLAVAGVIYATRQVNGTPAPTAEITPPTPTSEVDPPPRARPHFPTILRAKPVTEAESTASPRYERNDATPPVDDPEFDPVPADGFPAPPRLPPVTGFPPTSREPGTHSPAFSEPPGIGRQTSPTEVSASAPSSSQPTNAGPAYAGPTDAGPADARPADLQSSASEPADIEPEGVPRTYVTIAADSFWNISKQRYGGEGRYFKALYYHNRNRILRPDQIPAGIEIETPPLAELQRLYPDLCQPGQRN